MEWITLAQASMRSGVDARRLLGLLLDGRLVGRVSRRSPRKQRTEFTGVLVSPVSLQRWLDTQTELVAPWPKAISI